MQLTIEILPLIYACTTHNVRFDQSSINSSCIMYQNAINRAINRLLSQLSINWQLRWNNLKQLHRCFEWNVKWNYSHLYLFISTFGEFWGEFVNKSMPFLCWASVLCNTILAIVLYSIIEKTVWKWPPNNHWIRVKLFANIWKILVWFGNDDF